MDDDNIKEDDGLEKEDPLTPTDGKKGGLLDDETDEDVESLDDLKDDELAVDKDDLMDDVEEI